ncbi:3'-5' exonuclease [Neobacillus mesonae]|nr:3'-5' exonuclease [Neobacillus mesonae]
MYIQYLSDSEYLVRDVLVDRIHERPVCIFDLEGTGIMVEHEYITQFGAIIFHKGKILKTFSSLVKSPKVIPKKVEELTGISNESLLAAPTFAEVYQRFLKFGGTNVLVTQAGYEYDIPMLNKHCQMSHQTLFENPVIDTKALFTILHPELKDVFSTDYLIKHYKIETEDLQRHDALGDCVLISRIFSSILLEYKQRNIYSFNTNEGLIVRRFKIPEMYLNE